MKKHNIIALFDWQKTKFQYLYLFSQLCMHHILSIVQQVTVVMTFITTIFVVQVLHFFSFFFCILQDQGNGSISVVFQVFA